MSRSVCVGCGKSFDVPGADPAPYCLDCEPAAQRAFAARKRGGGGWLLGFAVLVVLLSFVAFMLTARDVGGPEPAVPQSSAPVRSR